MAILEDRIKELLLTHFPQEAKTVFLDKVAELVADFAVKSVIIANTLEQKEKITFDTSNWTDSKTFMCALGQEMNRTHQRPIYTPSDKRKFNAEVEVIYNKM